MELVSYVFGWKKLREIPEKADIIVRFYLAALAKNFATYC
jgi:hypothetical protein